MSKIYSAFLLLSCILFLSCEDSAITSGRKVYEAYLKKTLKDPGSLKIYKEHHYKIDTYHVGWEVDYGAKNSYGAMVRETLEFETVGSNIFIKGGDNYRLEDLE